MGHRKVVFVLELLGLSYESIYVDFNEREQKSPEHVKLNPNGCVQPTCCPVFRSYHFQADSDAHRP